MLWPAIKSRVTALSARCNGYLVLCFILLASLGMYAFYRPLLFSPSTLSVITLEEVRLNGTFTDSSDAYGVATANNNPRVAIVTLELRSEKDKEEFSEMFECSARSKKQYCQRYGFHLFNEEQYLGNSDELLPFLPWMDKYIKFYHKPRFLEWIMRKYADNYDWILWLDSDAYVVNQDIDLRTRIADLVHEWRHWNVLDMDDTSPREPLFIFAHDMNGINAGVYLMRSNREAYAYMYSFYHEPVDANDLWSDQRAVIQSFEEYSHMKKRAYLLPYERMRLLQSYYIDNDAKDAPHKYKPGDFILHTPGLTLAQKWEALRAVGMCAESENATTSTEAV